MCDLETKREAERPPRIFVADRGYIRIRDHFSIRAISIVSRLVLFDKKKNKVHKSQNLINAPCANISSRRYVSKRINNSDSSWKKSD